MQRKTLCSWMVALIVAAASCSGTQQTPVSPSAEMLLTSFANPDGSKVKATSPTGLTPSNNTVVDTLRPTLTFENSVGRFTNATFTYDVEVLNAAGTVVYSRTIAQGPTRTSHTMEADLTYSDTYSWRVRPRVGTDIGPLSASAAFRTLDRPGPPPPPPGGQLPFAVPAACGPGDPGNRIGCIVALASLSAEWAACARGSGVGCHRFTRQVAFSLSQSDPNWRMIRAAPGGHACNCSGCGPSDGTMFREDTVVYGGNRVFDLIVGAGGSSPSLSWGGVPGPRAGDSPAEAPLCNP